MRSRCLLEVCCYCTREGRGVCAEASTIRVLQVCAIVRACLQVGDYNVSVVAGGSSSIVNHSAFIRLDCPKEYFGTDGERCSACPVRGLAACIQECAIRVTIIEWCR